MVANFIVLSRTPANDSVIKGRISETFPTDRYYEIGRGQWLIASAGTAKSVYNKLIPDDSILKVEAGIVVFRISGYWGLAQTDMWEWMAATGDPKGA